MAKQELLLAIKERNHDSFVSLLKQHGNKRNPLDLGEVVNELSHGQLETVWGTLHSWANEQITKLVGGDSNSLQESQKDDDPKDAPQSKVLQVQMPDDGSQPSQAEAQVNVSQPGAEDPVSQPSQPAAQDPVSQPSQPEGQNLVSQPSQPDTQGGEQIVKEVVEGENNLQANVVEPYNEGILLGVLEFASIYLGTIKGHEAFIPDKLLELAVLLHGMVIVLEGKVQAGVISMCELWWLQELEEREHLIHNVFQILIESSLAKTGRKKDVVCVYNVRGALQVVEFNEPFVELLIACAACPLYLSCDEGLKFLSELFSWQALVPRLHRSIKSVLPGCTRNQSAKYAEVYFRAWKKSDGEVKQMIEENCIQDLMYAAVHVDPLTGWLSANLHHLLHHIHRHKRHHLVEKTILSLYNPFLWRSLKAANGYVRMNATGLLCDAFPLSDSTCSLEEREELLEKQYQTIIMLLTDPCHLVRITAVKGTCSILNNYWLMIPSQIIKTIFQKLLSDLLCDASSAEVRTQVVKGLTLLLDNNDAVPFLKEVIPRISDSFDDISTCVRIAFVNLLLKIKALKIIKYWSVVPVNHLLHRLEDDVPAVCKLLTQLLLSSFHPTQREDQELLQRCLALLEENRGAARRFYQYASRTLDLPSTVHFILLIWRCFRNFILSKQSQDAATEEGHNDCGDANTGSPASSGRGAPKGGTSNRTRPQSTRGPNIRTENEENRDSGNKRSDDADDDESSPLDNPVVIGGLLDTIVILWSTNAHRLAQPQNIKYLEALRVRISKSMPLFFKVFKDNNDVSQTLLYLSSFLPKSLVPTLVGHCLSRLRSLQQDEDNEDCYVTYINALCNWNRVDDVLELATDWLVEGFNTALISSSKERRRSGRGVRFHETYTAQPLLALQLIRHILQHPLNKLAALTKNRPLVVELAESISTVKDLIGERLNHGEELSSLCSDTFLCHCWAQYLSLIAVLHNPPKESPAECNAASEDEEEEEEVNTTFDSCIHILDCWDWANRVLVPVLSIEETGGKRKLRAGEDAIKIAIQALNNLLTTSNNLIIIGAADSSFVIKLCSFTDDLLKSDVCESFWDKSLLIALEGYQYLQVYEDPNDAIGSDVVTPVDLVNSCITSISECLQNDKILPKEADNLDKTLGMVLTTLCQKRRATQDEIFQHIAGTVVDHLSCNADKMKGVDREVKTVKEMGTCISLLIGVCQTRIKLSSALMEALAGFLTDSVMDTISLLVITHLLKVLYQDSGKISQYSLKKAVSGVDNIFCRIIFPVGLDESREGGSDAGINIYEEYAKTTKEILEDLKSSMGII